MEQMNIPALNHHVGSTERAFVAHVNDLNDFYLHPESVRDSLVQLGQELYSEYSESLSKPLGFNEKLNVGDYCACPSESEDWYRGLIRQLDSNGLAVVFKIDYGDIQNIPVQFLRPLQKRFFQLRRIAFHCSLANLIGPLDGWPLEIIEEFRSRLTTTFLYARFINYNEIRDISEVEITEKSSKTPLNKDFEQYQIQRSILEINDKLLFKYISMETLDPIIIHEIRLLYYISPSRFYVYSREKLSSHTSFQTDLQKAVKDLYPIQTLNKYQPVAALDNQAVWHRAIILDFTADQSKLCVYCIDTGIRECIPINNIRILPEEFQLKPALAIPCCLNNICPLNGNEQSTWKSNDLVHDEFNRLMINTVTCQIHGKQNHLYYDVQIEIPKIGDLGHFLCEKNLVSRRIMRNSERTTYNPGQSSQPSFVRAQLQASGISPSRPPRFPQPTDSYNNLNNIARPQPTRMSNTALQNPPMQQQSSNIPSSSVPTIPPQDGYYKIIQVRSAAEFYGLSQNREADLNNLFQQLGDYYNNIPNDQALNVNFFIEGALCAIQEGDKFHRVIIKHRESESRVSVKLVDRGDEIIVDTSELLQINTRFTNIPSFAQPFRLRGYDESQSSTNITINLKKLILNQRVQISHCTSPINGFYPVEVVINGNQSVNSTLFSNDKNLSIKSPDSSHRPNVNQIPPTHIESQVFNNSSRHHYHHPTMGQDMNQRTNEGLPAPQKILTGATRGQPGRFGGPTSNITSSNESTARFSSITNRTPQQSQPTDSAWNKDQNSSNNNFGNQSAFGRQPVGMNQRTDDNKISPLNNSDNRQQSSSYEQKNSYGGNGYSNDDRQQNNNESGRGGGGGGGFSNRGGFADRGRRGGGGFNDRNTGRNNDENNENNGQFSGESTRRGGGFGDRGRGGGYQDRNGPNRNYGDENNDRDSFRGGYSNRRDQGENGDSGRGFRGGSRGGFNNDRGGSRGGFNSDRGGSRGGFNSDRGGSRGGFNSDRGGSRGGFNSDRGGSRGGFNSDRGNSRDSDGAQLHLTTDKNNSTQSFSGWSAMRSGSSNFEAGDRFIENVIPKETFKFVVSHIETANDFFIQLLSKGDELTKLSETLQDEYKQSPELGLTLLKENQICLAKSPDGCWYRAIILSTDVNKTKVRFIDFGDTTEVKPNLIRQIAKKHCSASPYAFRCTFENGQIVENVTTQSIINKCLEKEFNGKIQTKTTDGKFLLESDDLLKLLLEINAIKIKSEIKLKRIKCLIGHIETEQHEFYIQDDEETLNKIADLIETEEKTAQTLSIDEVNQLEPKTKVIAMYEDLPFRGIITEINQSDENVNICFIDYGNTSSCSKDSLKQCNEQLGSYPDQAKHCRLYGISSDKLEDSYKDLSDNSAEDNIEISIINTENNINNVLIFIDNKCLNEKFGYDPSKTITEEEEKVNEDILTTTEPLVETTEETNPVENSPKIHQGILTHVEKTKPYVYLQLTPESDAILDHIKEVINDLIKEDKHNSSYEISDHVIAKFSEDEDYYRARIESYSSTSQLYTVYFLDFGNIDENVPIESLYSYSDDLKEIPPQAHGYLLDEIDSNIWNDTVRPLVENNLYGTVEFYFTDENNTMIHLKFDNENIEDKKSITNEENEENKTFQANVSAIDKDSFYIHIIPEGNLNACEMEENLQNCDKNRQDTWAVNDLCIVSDEENRFYRGKILAIDENTYDVKRIDYGNILENLTVDNLYAIPDEEFYKQSPIAQKCRLHEVDDVNQTKAVEEIIKNIPITESVTITVENDRNDPCLFVTLVRENNDIVNEKYLSEYNQTTDDENKQESDNDEKQETIEPNSSDTTNIIEQLPTQTDQLNTIENNSLLSNTNNQTIDFGENDPPTMIKDDTNTSISSD